MATRGKSRRGPARGGAGDGIPVLEWVGAATGAIIAAALLGLLGWDALTGHDRPADLVVEVVRRIPSSGSTTVEIRILNRGGRTAADVEVRGSAAAGGATYAAEMAFDLVPGHSEHGGALVFPPLADGAPVDVRVVGYRDP